LLVIGAILLAGALAWLLLPRSDRRPGGARAIEALKTLPYATWTEVADDDRLKNGVVLHDPERAWQGVNLYSSENEPGAFLIDMRGNVRLELHDTRAEPESWKLIEPAGPETFLVLANDGAILHVDARSRVLAEHKRTFHHDLELADDGLLYVIDRRIREVPPLAPHKPVRDDHLVALDRGGEPVLEISSVDLLLAEPALLEVAARQRRPLFDREVDIFHTNTISRLPRDVLRGTATVFERGDLLICWRNLDTVAVVDPDGPALRWYWGAGEIEWPHNPTLTDDGNLLIFDNGSFRGWSRVIELDPVSREIVWEYRGEPVESFFSSSRGSAQRLPNGNTLITDSMAGRVVEVTSEGEIVWEFFEPRTRRRWWRTERATIYRMTRLPRWPLPEETLPEEPLPEEPQPAATLPAAASR
jgi:hypothetical protein